MTTDQMLATLEIELAELCAELIPIIADDYRADDSDTVPSMALTVGADDTGAWGYQTGDNSYSGGAYGFPHWGVVSLYRDSDPAAIARDLVDQIADTLLDAEGE